MPDREKVIKGLECCTNAKHYELPLCYDCPYSNGVSCMDYMCSLHQDALDLLKAQESQTVSGWASVKDRLPRLEDRVLCYAKNAKGVHIVIGYFMGWHWQCGILCEVTHWMPLPEPPECQKKADVDKGHFRGR